MQPAPHKPPSPAHVDWPQFLPVARQAVPAPTDARAVFRTAWQCAVDQPLAVLALGAGGGLLLILVHMQIDAEMQSRLDFVRLAANPLVARLQPAGIYFEGIMVFGVVQVVATWTLARRLGLPANSVGGPRRLVVESIVAILLMVFLQTVIEVGFDSLVPLDGLRWKNQLAFAEYGRSVVALALTFLIWVPIHALVLLEGISPTQSARRSLRFTRHLRWALLAPVVAVAALVSLAQLVRDSTLSSWEYTEPGLHLTPASVAAGLSGIGVVMASMLGIALVAEARLAHQTYQEALALPGHSRRNAVTSLAQE